MNWNNFQSTIEQWRIVFWTVFGVNVLRVTVFSIWASGSVQPWNSPKKRVSFECEKLNGENAQQNTPNWFDLDNVIFVYGFDITENETKSILKQIKHK